MNSKLLICFLLLIPYFFSCIKEEKKTEKEDNLIEQTEDKSTTVKVMKVKEQDFNYELISNGRVNSMYKVTLKFSSNEIIKKIHVKNGSWVNKGQIIAELDKFKLESNLFQAEDSREKALLELQDVLIGQGYSLKDSTNIPPQVMKIARVRSNYDQSLNNYSIAKYNLEQATLYAPISGVIANLWDKELNYPNNPFCTVLDNRNPEIEFNILESEVNLVNLNDKVLVSPFSLPEHIVEGRISEINPLVDHNGMIRVKATVHNKGNKFYEGMNVKVKVQRLLGKRIVVPKTALVLRTNRKVIFTLKNNQSIWNYVETAQENSDSYVITEGINVGDSVIYEGSINLAHESPVIIK